MCACVEVQGRDASRVNAALSFVYGKRGLHVSKEACQCQKRPISVKRDLLFRSKCVLVLCICVCSGMNVHTPLPPPSPPPSYACTYTDTPAPPIPRHSFPPFVPSVCSLALMMHVPPKKHKKKSLQTIPTMPCRDIRRYSKWILAWIKWR